MKLTALDLTDCSGVRDLSPLKDMPLTTLTGYPGSPAVRKI